MTAVERPAGGETPLVMDRFVGLEGDGWVDLATNRAVTLVEEARSEESTVRWLERCGRLVSLWCSHLVELVDYAVVDGGRRLAAYPRLEPRARGAHADAVTRASTRTAIREATEAFLEARGISVRGLSEHQFVSGGARETRAIGFDLVHRPALEAIGEIVDTGRSGPVRVELRATPRAGLRTLLAAVAREARRCGVMPVCPAALARPEVWPSLRDRTVVLLDEGRASQTGEGAGEGMSDALTRALRRAGMVVAVVSRDGSSAAAPRAIAPNAVTVSLEIGPLSIAKLAAASTLFPPPPECERLALVRDSDGLPGRLADSWLARPNARSRVACLSPRDKRGSSRIGRAEPTWTLLAASAACRVAETRATWGVGPDRSQLDAAWRALASARISDALARFDRLIDDDTVARVEAMWGRGLCALEQARLVESERWLRAGLCACGESDAGCSHVTRQLTHALVRCLLWQGRVAEAATVLGRETLESVSIVDERWQWPRLRARIDLRLGRVASALAALSAAKRRCADDPIGRAAVSSDYARLLCQAGDAAGAAVHLSDAFHAARRIDRATPIRSRWLRLRIVWLEIQAASTATRSLQPVSTLTREQLQRVARRLLARDAPPLVRLRASRALEAFGWRRTRDVSAFVERWGEAPLSLLALREPAMGEPAMLNDLQTVLEICRDADEPYPALERVCHCVRDRLQAASVAVHAPAARGRLALAGSTRLPTAPLAERLLDSGVAAPVASADAGVEAGAPVTYAGRTIGAVVCRWTVGAPVDASDAETLLVTAAAAVAPHVQGLIDQDRREIETADDALGFLGASPAVVALRERVRRAALAPFHVLVEGESGSGKEVVARALHASGPRRRRRFCALNCAALTDDLIEAELFGHSRGAFTGAVGDRSGLFEEADGGTLFLDEVGELSPRAQAKLLRVIQDGEVRRVGENVARRVDARLIAATNRQLRDEAARGRFRADLLYRLDVVRIVVPPLRERPEDIVLLTRAFWRDAIGRVGSRATLHPNTVAALARYHWPGNVRELQNVVMALAVNAPSRGSVPASRLPAAIAAQTEGLALTLDAARRSFEERFVRAALARAGNRPCRAARELGLTRQGLRKLLVRLRIEIAPPQNETRDTAADTLTAERS